MPLYVQFFPGHSFDGTWMMRPRIWVVHRHLLTAKLLRIHLQPHNRRGSGSTLFHIDDFGV